MSIKSVLITVAVIIMLPLALYAWMIFDGFEDSVHQESDQGKFELRFINFIAQKSLPGLDHREIVPSKVWEHQGKRWAVGVLAPEIPVGAVVGMKLALIENGFYHHGGGMMGGGHYHIGRHNISSAILSVESNLPSVVYVERQSLPTNKCVYREVFMTCQPDSIRFEAKSPGTAVLTVTMTKINEALAKGNVEPVTDTITINVVPGS